MTERGTCSVCGRPMTLKKDGTLRQHSGLPWSWNGKAAYCCAGTGLKPKEPADD